MKITELLVSEQTIQPVGTIQQGGVTPMPTTTPTQAPGQPPGTATTATNTVTPGAKPVTPPGQQMGQQMGQTPGTVPQPPVNPAKAAQVQSLSTQIAQLQSKLAALNTQP